MDFAPEMLVRTQALTFHRSSYQLARSNGKDPQRGVVYQSTVSHLEPQQVQNVLHGPLSQVSFK